MKELAKRMMGRACSVYTVASEIESVKGVIEEVTDGGLLMDCNGRRQVINLEYVTRIQEWPVTSKAKKKRHSEEN